MKERQQSQTTVDIEDDDGQPNISPIHESTGKRKVGKSDNG